MIPVYLKRFAKILMLLLLVICTQANIPSVNAETAEDYQNQINSYTAQIESNPNDATLYYNRGVAYMKLFDIKFNDSEKEIFKQKRPFEEVKSMLEGIQYLRKNAYDDFDNAITLNQYYAEAYYARGMVYITKDFLDKPFAVLARYPGDNVEDFEKAILLKPDYTEAYNGCSKAYYMLADFALDLEKVKKIDSIEANTQMNSCINNAYKNSSMAIQLDPENYEYYDQHADMAFILHKYSESVADYNKMLELKGDNPKIYEKRGSMYVYMKKYPSAIDDYSKVIELYEKTESNKKILSQPYYERAKVYEKIKEYDKALDDYNMAIKYGGISSKDKKAKLEEAQKRMQKKVGKMSKS